MNPERSFILKKTIPEGHGFSGLPSVSFELTRNWPAGLLPTALAGGALLTACTDSQIDNLEVGAGAFFLNTGLTYLNLSIWLSPERNPPRPVKFGLSLASAAVISVLASKGACLGTAGLGILAIFGGTIVYNAGREAVKGNVSQISNLEMPEENGEE